MRDVYTYAKCVLVLDSWLQGIPSTSPMLDIVTRLYQSNWVRRLWTHQEGYLPKTIYVQFKDKAVELQELANRFTSWNDQLLTTGNIVGFPDKANLKLLLEYTFLKSAIQRTKKKWVTYLPLASAMAERQTSRLVDETACLATIVDMEVGPFLEISSKPDVNAAIRKRMALFLTKLGRFQMGFIFNNYDRLELPGFHWAPKSLLNFRNPERGYLEDKREVDLKEVNGKLGLLVEYSGFLVDFKDYKPLFGTLDRGCVIQCQGSGGSGQDIDGKYFVIELPPNTCHWTNTDQYAVILSKIPQVGGDRCLAVVGVSDPKPKNGIYTFTRYCSATARVVEDPPTWIDRNEYPILAEDTKWLMV
jgi:hypothetical protein